MFGAQESQALLPRGEAVRRLGVELLFAALSGLHLWRLSGEKISLKECHILQYIESTFWCLPKAHPV